MAISAEAVQIVGRNLLGSLNAPIGIKWRRAPVLQLPLGTFVFASMSRVCVGKELGLAVQRGRLSARRMTTFQHFPKCRAPFPIDELMKVNTPRGFLHVTAIHATLFDVAQHDVDPEKIWERGHRQKAPSRSEVQAGPRTGQRLQESGRTGAPCPHGSRLWFFRRAIRRSICIDGVEQPYAAG